MSWYKATYKEEESAETAKENPLFCNGRMSLIEFICLHVFVCLNAIMLASLPLLYFYLIPAKLQEYLDAPATTSTHPIRISRVAIGPFAQTGFNVDLSVGLNPFTQFPINAGFGDLNVRVVHQDNDLLLLNTPGMSLWMNQPNGIKPSLNFTWNQGHQENMQSFLANFSNDSLQEKKLMLYACPEIKLYSFTLYKSLCLHYTTQLDSIKPRLAALDANVPATPSSFVFDVPDTKSAQDALTANFGSDELSSLSSNFKFMWKKLFVYSDDNTISFEFVAEFVNPTVFELALIEKLDLFIELMGSKIVKVSLVKLGLSAALNNAFDMRIDLTFIGDSLDPHNTQLAIEQASKSYANTQDFEVAITGPFNITKAGFAAPITEKFKYTASFKDTMTYLYSHSENADSLTVNSLFDHSNMSISILPDQMDAFLGIQLPSFSSLKPPLNYSFPFFVDFDLYGADLQQRILKTRISPIVLQKSSNGFGIQTNASVIPENTEAAATSLGNTVNPILSRTPTASKIGLKDFSLWTDGVKPFLWCQKVFGERVLDFGLAPLNKSSWSSSLSNTSSSFAASLDGIVDVSQLNDKPGFQASGNVKVKYPSNLPVLKINLGYFGLQTTVESVPFANVELPNGLVYAPGLALTNVNAKAVLSRSPELSSKIQKLADYVVSSSAPPSFVGFTGVLFGSSPSSNIVTFSKIVYEVDPSDYISSASAAKSSSTLAPGSLKLDGVDLRVRSASDVSLAISSTFANPLPCNIAIGALSFDVLLDDKSLVSVSLPPLRIQSGNAPLNTSVSLKSNQYGDVILAEKVGMAYNTLFNGGRDTVLAGLTHIQLIPLSSSAEAAINQLENVKFTSKLSSSGSSSGSVLDYSKISQANSNSPILSSVQMLQFKAQENRNILAASDFAYSNPYPVSVDIPFLSLSSRLNQLPLVDLQLSSLAVSVGPGNMKPRAQLAFQKEPSLPDVFSKFYSSLESGSGDINDHLVMSSITFGSTSQERNVLLSKIPLDATSSVFKFFKKGDASSSSTASGFGNDFSASMDYANIRVLPSATVGFDTGSNLKSSVIFDIDLPYLNLQPIVDGIPVGSLTTSVASDAKTAKLIGELHLDDSDQLASHIGDLYHSYEESKVTPAHLQAAGLLFGSSPEDAIDLFSKTALSYNIKDLSSSSSTPSNLSSFSSFKTILTNTSVSVQPSRTMLIDSHIAFDNSYKISISGLGFISAMAGVDGVPIMQLSSGGFDVAQGSNSFNPTFKTIFPSSLAAQDKVASFGENLWNHYGETTEKLFGSEFLFGASEQDQIKAFSKLDISVASSKFFTKSDSPSQKQDISSVFSVSLLDLKFNPSNVVNAAIQGAANLSYQLSVVFPYLSIGGDIESNHLFDVGLSGLSLSGGKNLLNVTSEITLQDNDALSTSIGTAYEEYSSGAKLSGSASVGYMKFGSDSKSDNVIDTFAKLRLSMGLASLLSSSSSSGNATPSFKDIHFATDDIEAKVLPGRNIQAKFGASFNSTLPISVQGLGLISSGFAINNVPSLRLIVNGANISPGSNKLDIDSNLIFETGDAVSSSFAALYEEYQTKVPISESLIATGTVFGFSSDHSFSLLSKCKFNGTSSLKSFLVPSDSPSKPLFSEYLLPKLHLGTLPSGEITLDVGATLKNASLHLGGGQIGYLHVNSLIDNQQFVNVSLSGLNVTSVSEKKDLEFAFSSSILFGQEEGTKELLARVFEKYWKKLPVGNEVVLSGLLLGTDGKSENVIDAFSKIKIQKPLADFLLTNNDEKKPAILPAGFTYNITYADLDLLDNSTITSKITASFDLGPEIHAKDFEVSLPFVSGSVLYNHSDFVTLSLNDIGVQASDFSVTASLQSRGNKAAWNSLVYIAGLVEADRYESVPDIMLFRGFAFGSAPSTPISTFSKMTVVESIDNLVNRFSGAANTTTIKDLRIEVHPQGLLTDVYTAIDFPNFHSKVDIEFQSHFQPKQSGPIYPYATYKITDFSFPNPKLFAYPILHNNSASVALKNYISVFATDYLTEDSLYGFVSITSSKTGLVFSDLDQAFLYGPRGSDWAPYVVDIVPPNDWTWDIEHAGYLNGPFHLKGKFHNYGVTHFDLGDLFVQINVSGNPLVTIETVKPLVVVNKNEGGATDIQAKYPVMGELGFLWPKEYYGEFWFTHLLGALYDARENPSHVSFEYGFRRNGVAIQYMNQVIDNMPTKASTNSTFSICDMLAFLRLEIFDKPGSEYPLLVPFEHSINSLFLHCNFAAPSQPIPLETFIKNTKLSKSLKNNTDLGQFPTLSDLNF